MKNFVKCLLFLGLGLSNFSSFSQVSISANAGVAGDYVGWDNTMLGIPVQIKHELDTAIYFYTNAGNNTFNNRKMMIWRRTLNNIEHAGVGIQSTGGTNITRLRSLLHLGNNSVAGIAGWRPWLDVGTFCAKGSDYAYFGTMTEDGDSTVIGGDDNDAVIVWGDNLHDPHDDADNLRIIFNAPMTNATTANQYQGLEISRYSPLGRVGIGNFTPLASGNGSGIEPLRRLEIYGENNDTLLNSAAPQLRLTYTPNANVNLGINTDFETTFLGDLFINPRSAGVFRNVGINTSAPGATLEINSNFASSSSQSSGLMFSDLRPTSPNGITSYGRVLTVDNNGLVVLTDDNGGNGTITACGSVPGDVDFITKWSTITSGVGGTREICRTSGIYESPIGNFTVGIGVGSTPNAAFKLHVLGDYLIERNGGGVNDGNIYMAVAGAPHRVFAQFGASGFSSLAIGNDAGPSSFTGISSTGCLYIGLLAGRNTSTNIYNTFTGAQSGFALGTGDNNTFNGGQSAFNITIGDDNTFIGHRSAFSLQNGNYNSFLGSQAGAVFMTKGDHNLFLGYGTTLYDPIGQKNILIGNNASGLNAAGGGTLTNAGTIGYAGAVYCSDCFTIAAQNYGTQQQVGIGFTSPATTPIPPPLGVVPPPPPATPAKLYVNNFNGGATSAYFNGQIYTNGAYLPSDSSLKMNIQNFSNALQIINQLEVKSYEFNQSAYPSMVLPAGNQVGLMANNVNSLTPQLIGQFANPAIYDTSGNIVNPQIDFLAVNYTGLIPYLVSAIKEQQTLLDSLSQALSNCCALPITPDPANRATINLSNHASIILNQNVPNPFKDRTEISYSIPENVTGAMILFYDQSGKILNTYEINHKGDGTLTVYGDNLSEGIYTYTLMINGEPVKTKRMVKE